MPPAGFEPSIPAGERLQTHALDRLATGISVYIYTHTHTHIYICVCVCVKRSYKTQRWRKTFLYDKWLYMNEQRTHAKRISYTKITELKWYVFTQMKRKNGKTTRKKPCKLRGNGRREIKNKILYRNRNKPHNFRVFISQRKVSLY
jgi:hypothetical protein